MSEARTIGAALPRKEDFRLLTGQGRYLDDIAVPNCLHAHFVRSPHPHARIVSIEIEAARAAEGVVAVVTGRELSEWTTPQRMAPPIEGLHPTEFPTLPRDKVRFIGDPVVCIVATDPYNAEDSAEHVDNFNVPLEAVSIGKHLTSRHREGRGRTIADLGHPSSLASKAFDSCTCR